MGKKLIFDYEFDASAGTITVNDIYAEKRWQLITNLSNNLVIYQFNDNAFGISNISFDYPNTKTTITLAYDTSSMSDTDELQIFIDDGSTDVTVNDRFVDPVSKIRVSNPENLIDTDFEYGLQSTKWETLELTANIPTFFSRSGDFNLEITSMNVTANSDVVTVVTVETHGFQRGSPIIVQGSGDISADGGFVVSGVIDDNTFLYKAKNTFTVTRSIKDTFTQLFPGSIYSGSEFKLTNVGGITTDSATPNSELTVSTVYPTDFEPGTSMALANTFARATLPFSTDNANVNTVSTTTQSYTSATATGETDDFLLGGVSCFDWVPEDAVFFEEGETTISFGYRITFPEPHGFVNYDPVVYVADTQSNPSIITGTNSSYPFVPFKVYYVYYVNSTTIELRRIRNISSTYRVYNLTNGVSGGVTKSAFMLARQAYRYYGNYRAFRFYDNWSSLYGNARQRTFAFLGNEYVGGGSLTSEVTSLYSGNSGNGSQDYGLQLYTGSNYVRAYYDLTTSNYINTSSYYYDAYFFGRIKSENRRSSFWMPNHGLETGDYITITATQGTLPTGLASGTIYQVAKVDDNRVGLNFSYGSQVYLQGGGSSDLIYEFEKVAADADRDKINIPANTLSDGDPIVYSDGGGTPITAVAPSGNSLTSGSTYYVANKTGDKFMVSETKNPAGDSFTITQRSSTYVQYPLNYIRFYLQTPTFVTGDAVRYTAPNNLPPLVSGQVYFVRMFNTNYAYLYYTRADALADTNRINIIYYAPSNTTATFTKYDIFDITAVPNPAETHSFEADFVGAADGNYTIATNADDQLSFTFDAGGQIQPRIKTVESQDSFVATYNAFYVLDHGFITGDSVEYTESGSTNLSGLTSGTTYYVIALNKDFFSLATTEENANSGQKIPLTEIAGSATPFTGTFSFEPTTIVGRFSGSGTVSYEASSTTVTGEGTSFTSYFNKGDDLILNLPETTTTTAITSYSTADYFVANGHGLATGDLIRFTATTTLPPGIDSTKVYYARLRDVNSFYVHYTQTDAAAGTNVIQLTGAGSGASVNHMSDTGDLTERLINYVNSDGQITLEEALPATAQTEVNYLQRTSLLLRPDGFALHRPYDGGVELIPPTNPDSAMIRQTRKYFRYQSGKGIQVSYAVNFSPTSQIDTFSRSGSTGTVKTRFPHRLSAGLAITVSGSTNAPDTLGTEILAVRVVDNGAGQNVFSINNEIVTSVTLYEGRTYRFDQSDSSNSGHPIRLSTTEDGTHGGGTEYTTGVTTGGTPGTDGYTEITVEASAPDLYTYCQVHVGMGFAAPTPTDPDNNTANLWNGVFNIESIVDETTFTVTLRGTPSDAQAAGVVEYYVNNWANSALRCGLFDEQNGLFFEYDGQELYCCRRSSVRQISGYATVQFRSGEVTGADTKFTTQLRKGDKIVIKGQSHLVTRIDSDNVMYIAPSYRGVDATKVVITKTEDTKVPQREWNEDVCDGTGYTGFKLDLHKIQMAYMDYSWYGAGKVRFGFKDQHGNVRYVHSFVHGNFFTEAYMRSGNVPARYTIENIGTPTYVPALAHWGTSVIMDGRFDPDKAYIFNASSNNLALTGAASDTVSAKVDYTDIYYYRINSRNYAPIGYALLLDAPEAVLGSFSAGTTITGADLPAGTKLANPKSTSVSPYQPYLPSIYSAEVHPSFGYFTQLSTRDLLVVDSPPTGVSGGSSTYTIGAGGEALNVTKELPLISIRLAPSVDTSAPGFLGEREIINRMQLILNQVSVLSTHACTVRLVLNGQLSSNAWQRVTNPSLSQLILHENADSITGGLSVYNFEASGGSGTSARTPQLTSENLGDIATLGNSILGGDNVFPDGPDVLTVVVVLNEDPSTVSASNPFTASGRISWSESQA